MISRAHQVILVLLLIVVELLLLFGGMFEELKPQAPSLILWTGLGFSVGYMVAVGLQVYAHEFGHLVAALLLRVRIREVALFGRPGLSARRIFGVPVHLGLGLRGHSHVRFSFAPGDRFIALRRALIALAGPLVNLAVAAGTAEFIVRHWRPGGSYDALSVVVKYFLWNLVCFGVVQGASNLLPFRSRSGQISDGLQVLISARQPLLTAQEPGLVGGTPEAQEVKQPDDLNRLRTMIHGRDPQNAALAATELFSALMQDGRLSDEALRELAAVATLKSLSPEFSAVFAGAIADLMVTNAINFDCGKSRPRRPRVELTHPRGHGARRTRTSSPAGGCQDPCPARARTDRAEPASGSPGAAGPCGRRGGTRAASRCAGRAGDRRG